MFVSQCTMISKYILHICKDTYFILQNKYFHIYDDSLEQRNLELIALFNNYKLRRYNDGSFFVFYFFWTKLFHRIWISDEALFIFFNNPKLTLLWQQLLHSRHSHGNNVLIHQRRHWTWSFEHNIGISPGWLGRLFIQIW